jgi:hypothetical protein
MSGTERDGIRKIGDIYYFNGPDRYGVTRERSAKTKIYREAVARRSAWIKREEDIRLGRTKPTDYIQEDAAQTNVEDIRRLIADYLEVQSGKCKPMSVTRTRKGLEYLLELGKVRNLIEINYKSVERMTLALKKLGRADTTIRGYQDAVTGFCRWLVKHERLPSMPFPVDKWKWAVTSMKRTRPMTVDELVRLCNAARTRLADDLLKIQ